MFKFRPAIHTIVAALCVALSRLNDPTTVAEVKPEDGLPIRGESNRRHLRLSGDAYCHVLRGLYCIIGAEVGDNVAKQVRDVGINWGGSSTWYDDVCQAVQLAIETNEEQINGLPCWAKRDAC